MILEGLIVVTCLKADKGSCKELEKSYYRTEGYEADINKLRKIYLGPYEQQLKYPAIIGGIMYERRIDMTIYHTRSCNISLGLYETKQTFLFKKTFP
jgi:hypothetical protein